MQKHFLAGALGAATFGFCCAPVTAEPLPAQNAPAIAQEQPAENERAKSGYDLFVEARALIQAGLDGEPLTMEKLAPAENLRLQRLSTARNAPALDKLRAALKAYIVFPEFDDEAPREGAPKKVDSYFESISAARNFARYLSQEAAVRAADGDAVAAAQSSLDAFELSTQVARGPIINALSGSAMASVARKALLLNVRSLDAAQLRVVADKWEKISGDFPTYAQTLRDEEQTQLHLMYRNIASTIALWSDPVVMGQAETDLKEARANGEITEQEFAQAEISSRQIKGLTFADINAELRQIFDGALLRANKPYSLAKNEAPLPSTNALTYFSAELVSSANTRFYAPRETVNNRALVAALRLRAAKLETGAYPATFDAGVDPFSPTLAPLIYKRAGDAYVLYSVGPDGKDENGAEIQTLTTDAKTGAKKVSDRLAPDSTGDISAPVL